MVSSNIRDLLTSFSPSSDFFAISSGDGRIKIWDTLKGQLQTEFADLASNDVTDFLSKSQSGHLSLDYSCMKWLPLERKKKKKNARSLLALGTASGDVLALDVTVGDLKWRFSDCHPGGVNAISFSTHSSCIYSAGVDGVVCRIDYMSGSLLGKFKASTKEISSMAISPDGSMLATAAAQLKLFSSSDNKKLQKFSGHTVAARCMIFTDDGKYVLSSAVGERYIAIWKVDGSKKKSASCVLSMEHPAVFLHCKCTGDAGDVGLYVLAISESGHCYFWYGKDVEELRTAKPTRISLSSEEHRSKSHKGALPMIFAAELQATVKPGSVQVLFAYGSLIKPSFEKKIVQYGIDVMLNSTQGGVLLPMGQSQKSLKNQVVQTQVTALDRGNAEYALLPNPKIHDSRGQKKRHRHSSTDREDVMDVDFIDKSQAMPIDTRDQETIEEGDTGAICMEERLRSLGILSDKDEPSTESYSRIVNKLALGSAFFQDGHFEVAIPQNKIKAAIKSMASHDAYTLLTALVATWKSRSGSGNYVLPWIYSILVYHNDYVISQKASTEMLDSIYQMVESKRAATQSLLQLAGRMQLIQAQIDKGDKKNTQTPSLDEAESEDEDEDVDEVVYGEDEDDSASSSSSRDGDN